MNDSLEDSNSSRSFEKHNIDDQVTSDNHRSHINSFNDVNIPSSVVEESKYRSSNANVINSRISKSSYSDEESQIANIKCKNFYKHKDFNVMSDDSELSEVMPIRNPKFKTMHM